MRCGCGEKWKETVGHREIPVKRCIIDTIESKAAEGLDEVIKIKSGKKLFRVVSGTHSSKDDLQFSTNKNSNLED